MLGYIITALIAAGAVAAVVINVRRFIKNKGCCGCDGNCADCEKR